MSREIYDAVVVGSGPNGLAAAITLAKAGFSVLILEAKESIGGGLRSAELTLPGFVHDICSAVHPLAVSSPFFTSLPLAQHGLEWIQPSAPLAHPMEDGSVVLLERSIQGTAKGLGKDGDAYVNLMEPLVESWKDIENDILGPLRWPSHPLKMARFGFYGLKSAEGLAKRFKEERTRALLAGLAAHSILPLNKLTTAAIALVLGILGHHVGWPIPRGGSQMIAKALASYFVSLGGQIETGVSVDSMSKVPKSRVVLFDLSPRQIIQIAGDQLPSRYRSQLENYRYGPGVFKIDWALSQPIPWKAEECSRAATVHIGGTMAEIAKSEREVWEGKYSEKNFVLLAQQSLFDSSRAPHGKHTAWAYCHVPNGSQKDRTTQIEAQIERFAPGFKECILARSTKTAAELETYNSNYIGGDIIGGVQDIFQLYSRPVSILNPYSLQAKGLYICSSSTPPGGGVHGMCGYHAARAASSDLLQ